MFVCTCEHICVTSPLAVSMSTLRQIAVDKMEQVPTLGQVMPYLDITSKQDYVVQRLKG